MSLILGAGILRRICSHGESCYPDEGAGLLLGRAVGGDRLVTDILPLSNSYEAGSRRKRYLINPLEMLRGEEEAEERGVEVVGVFHSHPDHPAQPSEFDREQALPWYSYVITSVDRGAAGMTRAWRLSDDHLSFSEENVVSQAEGFLEAK